MLRLASIALAAVLALGHPAAAQDRPTLNVYTYDSFAAEWGPGPALKAGFEQTCSCTIKYVAAEDAISILRRVQLEGPTTDADVIVGLDTFIAGDARATGLFTPHKLDLTTLALPEPWTDDTFVPFDHGYFAFVYNTTTLPEPPRSFLDLVAMPNDFRIVVMDPRSSTPGLGLVVWLKEAYGDKAAEIWAGLKPHILTMSKGWSEGYGLFLSGEADMVLSYTTSPAYHMITEQDDRFAAAEFAEGHIQQIEVSAILASSSQQDLARHFLAYMSSVEGQKIIPTTNWMYPVVELGADLPAAFGKQPAKILPVDETSVLAERDSWIEEALGAIR